MVEYPQHKKGKERIRTILTDAGWTVSLEKEMPQATTAGERNYIADVYAFKVVKFIENNTFTIGVQQIIIEVDGKKGHRGTIAARKQALRDETFASKGIKTIRFPTGWLIGKKALDDGALLEEINWRLNH
jgi:hypothetical protein